MNRFRGALLWVAMLAAWMGCQRPRSQPVAPPVAVLRIVFSDGVVEVGLDQRPPEGSWALMDAGLWSPLSMVWIAMDRAQAEVGRTAPDWLVLKDPAGGVHRLVLREAPDPVPMPVAGRLHDPGRETEDDREAVALIGLAWVLSFVRR